MGQMCAEQTVCSCAQGHIVGGLRVEIDRGLLFLQQHRQPHTKVHYLDVRVKLNTAVFVRNTYIGRLMRQQVMDPYHQKRFFGHPT